MRPYKVLSFGGGIQTTALGILVARGEIEADIMVMADTGGELPQTYRHLWTFAEWLLGRGLSIHMVSSSEGSLERWIHEKSAPIPVHIGNGEGLGHRQCTRMWKIKPIIDFARARAGERDIEMMLGISTDESHRMKDSPDKGVVRSWPLIDLGLSREDCRKIILDEGFTSVPKSACYYCPLLGPHHFSRLAADQPELFQRAVAIEEVISLRRVAKGQKPAFLARYGKPFRGRPLRDLDTGQMAMLPSYDAGNEEDECEGTCFV